MRERYYNDKIVYLIEDPMPKTFGRKLLDFVSSKKQPTTAARMKLEATKARIANRIHCEFTMCSAQFEKHMQQFINDILREELK